MSGSRFATLRERRDELVEVLGAALSTNVFANRFMFHPEELPTVAREATDSFLAFVDSEDGDAARALGDSLERRGLGDSSQIALLLRLHQFCASIPTNDDSADAKGLLTLVERFAASLVSGFGAAREEEIIAEQEQLRHALSTAIESQSRELFVKNHAIATAISGIVLADLDGRVTYVNRAFLTLWGYQSADEVVGKGFDGLWDDEDGRRILDRIVSRGGWVADHTGRKADGTGITVSLSASVIRDPSGAAIGIMASLVDMTERKHLETQMQQVQKMDDLGRLAGGIVHDFNNLLTAIGGYLQLLLLEAPPDSKLARDLTQIKIAVDRGTGLTKQLHYFTRQATGTKKLISLNDIVNETVALLNHSFPPGISIDLALSADLWMIEADSNQMSQVLMNLCVNAREAIEERVSDDSRSRPEGTVAIETGNVALTEERTGSHGSVTPGSYVRLRVSDSGVGMPPELVERLFIPFVSTKAEKRGGGLGLSVVYGIVRSHGGFIDVESTPGSGAGFFIYLPMAHQSSDGRPKPKSGMTLAKGTGTILVVDDEEQVREIIVRSLTSCGYRVHAAESGEAAVEFYTRHGEEIDLVILDMVMPGMDGRETFSKLREIDPAVAVLLVTGYTAQAPEELGAKGLIEKPLDLRRFTAHVGELIEAGR